MLGCWSVLATRASARMRSSKSWMSSSHCGASNCRKATTRSERAFFALRTVPMLPRGSSWITSSRSTRRAAAVLSVGTLAVSGIRKPNLACTLGRTSKTIIAQTEALASSKTVAARGYEGHFFKSPEPRVLCGVRDRYSFDTRGYSDPSLCSGLRRKRPQLPVKEIRGRFVSANPRLPQQEVMNFVRKNNLLKRHMILAQSLDQVRSLLERNVAVVVAVHEQYRRLPCRNGSHWRRVIRQLERFLVIRRRFSGDAANKYRPIVYALKIYACCKHVGIARERQRRHKSAVGSAPYADT